MSTPSRIDPPPLPGPALDRNFGPRALLAVNRSDYRIDSWRQSLNRSNGALSEARKPIGVRGVQRALDVGKAFAEQHPALSISVTVSLDLQLATNFFR